MSSWLDVVHDHRLLSQWAYMNASVLMNELHIHQLKLNKGMHSVTELPLALHLVWKTFINTCKNWNRGMAQWSILKNLPWITFPFCNIFTVWVNCQCSCINGFLWPMQCVQLWYVFSPFFPSSYFPLVSSIEWMFKIMKAVKIPLLGHKPYVILWNVLLLS